MDEKKFDIKCPCCEARLMIDGTTGSVLWHEAKKTEKGIPSIDEMIKNLDLQKKAVAEKIENESRGLKDRSRILEEKVKESMKHLNRDEDMRPIRPIDLD